MFTPPILKSPISKFNFFLRNLPQNPELLDFKTPNYLISFKYQQFNSHNDFCDCIYFEHL